MAVVIPTSDDAEMEKIAEDELAKLQRQFRLIEVERVAVSSGAQASLRAQRSLLHALHADLDKLVLELKLTKSTTNVMQTARARERLGALLSAHERCAGAARALRQEIAEVDFLIKQVQKEIKGLQAKGSRADEEHQKSLMSYTILSQLENRLDTVMKRFNCANSDNLALRQDIDRLLHERQSFNLLWKQQVKKLMEGKAHMIELVEQAIATYEQREEWCSKLEKLKEKAAYDYRRHCLEVRELQRQLDYRMKLEEFLRTKGTVRVTAADARAQARKLQQQELEQQTYCQYLNILDAIKVKIKSEVLCRMKPQIIYNQYVNIVDAIKEFTGESDIDKLIVEFTRTEEENYALFNYVNEVNSELKSLHDNVRNLEISIDEERAKHEAQMAKQQESAGSLQQELAQKKEDTAALEEQLRRSTDTLHQLLDSVRELAALSDCSSLPLVMLLGPEIQVNEGNVRLYLKSVEKKTLEMTEIIKADEALQRVAEARQKTPPSGRARGRTPRRTPRSPRDRAVPRPAPRHPPPNPALLAV